jgi:hypothetical protein
MMRMACVRSELVGSDVVQNLLQAPKYFPGQMMFQEKQCDLLDERFSIDEQQLRQVQHGQLCHRLLELP